MIRYHINPLHFKSLYECVQRLLGELCQCKYLHNFYYFNFYCLCVLGPLFLLSTVFVLEAFASAQPKDKNKDQQKRPKRKKKLSLIRFGHILILLIMLGTIHLEHQHGRGGGVSPCADGPKVTVHKDQKSPS